MTFEGIIAIAIVAGWCAVVLEPAISSWWRGGIDG